MSIGENTKGVMNGGRAAGSGKVLASLAVRSEIISSSTQDRAEGKKKKKKRKEKNKIKQNYEFQKEETRKSGGQISRSNNKNGGMG